MTASSIAKAANANTPLEKARAIYNWAVDNAHRDQTAHGCEAG